MRARKGQASLEALICGVAYMALAVVVVYALDAATVMQRFEAARAGFAMAVEATGEVSSVRALHEDSLNVAPTVSSAPGACELDGQAMGLEVLDEHLSWTRIEVEHESPASWPMGEHALEGRLCLPTGSLTLEAMGGGLLQLDPEGLLSGADERLEPIFH